MAQWLDYSRMVGGVQHVRPLRRAYVRQNNVIFDATQNLRLGHYNVAEFLSRVSHLTRHLINRLHGPRAAQVVQPAAEPMVPLPPEQVQQQQQQLPAVEQNENAAAAVVPQNQPRRGRGGGRRGRAGRGGRVRGRGRDQAPGERGGGVVVEFLQNPWPLDQAEHLSQLQQAHLAAIETNDDDAIAGEGDLSCITCGVHKRSYITEPCGHFAMCGTCVIVHRRTINYDENNDIPIPINCPVCRRTLAGYRRIYQ